LNEKREHDGGVQPGAGAAAAEEAFRLHYGRILSYLLSRTERDVAEEVTQQVFAEATRAFVVSGEAPSNVLAWLYTVASRRLTDELRRRVRMRNGLVDLQAVAGAETKDQEYGRLVARALVRSVGALPPKDRMLVRGRLLEDRSFSELAAKLAISEPACKMRFSRAMRLVRASLEAEGLP
jgi:RNA polymerase sigma-70 factor (ECF subfamily)